MGKQQSTSKSRSKVSRLARTSKKSAAKPARSGSRRKDSPNSAGAEDVTIDRRRGARRSGERCQSTAKVVDTPQLERREKVNRRRQIDPTTCERDYTDQEVEFMNALDDYKRRSGRMFPTCSEVLEVIRMLGYVKVSPAEVPLYDSASNPVCSAKPMSSPCGLTSDHARQNSAIPALAAE